MLQAAVAAVVWVHSPQKSIQWDHLNLMMKDFYGNGSGLYQMTLLPSTGHEWLWWWVWWYESHVGRDTFYKQICAQNKPGIRFSVPFWYLLYKLCWLSWFFGFFFFFCYPCNWWCLIIWRFKKSSLSGAFWGKLSYLYWFATDALALYAFKAWSLK